jgi:hypothetical protein
MLKDGESFSPSDVADAMILLKVARNVKVKTRDNYVDIGGYAGCAWEAELSTQDRDYEKLRQALDLPPE